VQDLQLRRIFHVEGTYTERTYVHVSRIGKPGERTLAAARLFPRVILSSELAAELAALDSESSEWLAWIVHANVVDREFFLTCLATRRRGGFYEPGFGGRLF
jgi:hypothetical protein